jgi:hypothetical protein
MPELKPIAPISAGVSPTPKQPSAPKKATDVGEAMKQERGEGGKKKPSQIIYNYVMAQTGGDQQKAEATIAHIGQLVQQKKARIIQFGNTAFWATQKGPATIDVHIFTEESPQVLVKRMRQAWEWAKKHGFKEVTTTLTDGRFSELIKMAGVPFTQSQTVINDGQKMTPAYLIRMEVK